MPIDRKTISVPWPVGSKIKGRYEVMDIKHGGFATVYMCYDHEFQIHLAVKTFQDRFLRERAVVDRFLREAELWMRLEKHKNIVWAKWIDNINDRPCIFMEYISIHKGISSDLGGWIGKKELSVELSLSFAIQICCGMIYAQRKFSQRGRQFIHRDLKPANIMIAADGIAKVTDFGFAKVFSKTADDEQDSNTSDKYSKGKFLSTSIDEIFGTPAYMAPEQWISSRDLDIRADIYSFGCILYEMIVGRPPFVAHDLIEYKNKHLQDTPKYFAELGLNLPDEFEQVLSKCLEKKTDERFQSFEELRNNLVQIYNRLTGEWFEYSDNPETLDVYELSNIAMSLLELGKSQEALEYYDRLLGQIADGVSLDMVARIFNNRGNCHNNLGNFDSALANYELAKRIDASYDYPWFNSAGIYFAQEDYQKALVEANQAIEINPEYPDSHTRLAKILLHLGKYKEAIEKCNISLKLDPSQVEVYESRAQAYAALGDMKRADADNAIARKLRGD